MNKITYICDNCGQEFEEEPITCEKCGATLCPDCICEECENES